MGMLIKASREVTHGAVVDLQKTRFNRFETKLKWATIGACLIVSALHITEASINHTDCYNEKFAHLTGIINYVLLATTAGVCFWFICVARA